MINWMIKLVVNCFCISWLFESPERSVGMHAGISPSFLVLVVVVA